MEKADLVILGGTILTMDDKDAVLKDGALAVKGDSIVALSGRREIEERFESPVVMEKEDSIIMPGLINGHTHAAMTCFRGLADDLELMDWLNNYIFPAEARNLNPELAYWGSLLACAEMIRSGTTTFCDMYLFEDETAQAVQASGMRALLGEGVFDFPSANAKTPAAGLAYGRKLIKKWADNPLINFIVAPHSLYTCSPPLLLEAKKRADEFALPYAVHLLENRSEREQLLDKFGRSPVEFLREIGYLTERFIAYHCVAMEIDDIEMFSDHGCKVVHTPESNMKLASGVAPVPAMLRAGICVGLGTDGCASNNNLDMFQEMATAAKLHKLAALDPTVMDAMTVLRLATGGGARVLGIDNRVGSLEVGKKADIIIIDLDKPHLNPLYNVPSHLVYSAGGADVDDVIINGRLVMEGRRLPHMNEREAINRVRKIAEKIKNNFSPS